MFTGTRNFLEGVVDRPIYTLTVCLNAKTKVLREFVLLYCQVEMWHKLQSLQEIMLWKHEKQFVPWSVVCASVYMIHSRNTDISLNILKKVLEELADVPFSFSINWMEWLMRPSADSSYSFLPSQLSRGHGIGSILFTAAPTTNSVQYVLHILVE